MRKMLLIPLIAVAVMASQAGAAVCKVPADAPSGGGKTAYCQYSTGCFELSTEYSSAPGCTKPNCDCDDDLIPGCIEANGTVFTDVTGLNAANEYGEGVIYKDNGGNWTGLGKDPNAASLGWYIECMNHANIFQDYSQTTQNPESFPVSCTPRIK
jgi:hypothetical protein